jgi:DNA-binding transcriptional regulator GbsR (MarR family)
LNEKKIYKVFEKIALPVQLKNVVVNLPIAFEYRYDYLEMTILNENKRFVLVKEKRTGSIESFINQADKIGEIIGQKIILVFTEIPEKTRTLLLKARIPFVDYKGNLFIPDLGMSLKRIQNIELGLKDKLSPSEQAVLISILLRTGKGFTPNEISEITGVSIPTVYRGLKKFSSFKWIESEYGSYSFLLSKNDVFEKAASFFTNPKKQSVYLKHKDINQLSEIETTNTRLKVAGLPALSRISNLANTEEVYATSLKVFKESIEDSIMSNKEVFEVNIGNRVELELWSYSPFSLSNDRFVDPISLYFSLKDSDDPRIEMELDELLYKIKQSLE